MHNIHRKYLTIEDIRQKYLPVKIIGGRIYTEREALEALLGNPDRDILPLN